MKSGAALHVIALGTPSGSMDDEMRNRGQVISEGTARTGGRRDQVLALSGHSRQAETGGRRAAEPVRGHLRPSRQADSAGEDQPSARPARTSPCARAPGSPIADAPPDAASRRRADRARLRRRPARDRRGAGALPRRRRSRVAQRHGHRRRRRYVTDLEEGEIRGLRGRRQAGRSPSSRGCSSRSRWPSCSTPARAWTSSSRPRRKRRSASPAACAERR